MEELIGFLIENLAENPESITIKRQENEIVITAPKSEMGKLIGRQGRIAKAIRTIAKAACKDGEKVAIEIVEA